MNTENKTIYFLTIEGADALGETAGKRVTLSDIRERIAYTNSFTTVTESGVFVTTRKKCIKYATVNDPEEQASKNLFKFGDRVLKDSGGMKSTGIVTHVLISPDYDYYVYVDFVRTEQSLLTLIESPAKFYLTEAGADLWGGIAGETITLVDLFGTKIETDQYEKEEEPKVVTVNHAGIWVDGILYASVNAPEVDKDKE